VERVTTLPHHSPFTIQHSSLRIQLLLQFPHLLVPGDGHIPRFGLAEIGVERQGEEPLPPTPALQKLHVQQILEKTQNSFRLIQTGP